MSERASKKQGTPNWVDCATDDLEASERFYRDVFGWESEHVGDSAGALYSLQRLDGALVAGIYELDDRLREMGVPSHWGTYIEVDDFDQVLARVEAEGGSVLEDPIDEPDVGKIAIVQDPVGAYVRLWDSAPGQGGEMFNVPGALMWNELNTKSPERAAEFYRKVLGVEVETMEEPTPYTTLNVDGRPVAGILRTTPEMGDFPPTWDVYFGTGNVDETCEKVLSAGGKALREPFDIPGVGRMAVLQDPRGAVFEVMTMG